MLYSISSHAGTGIKIQSTLTYRLDEVLKLRLLP